MKPKIFIDPGHGGTDPGAAAHGILEKDLNLMVSRELSSLLNLSTYEVMLSRSTDVAVSLKARTDIATKWGADILLSIHHNAFSNPVANGYEIYYQLFRALFKDDSFRLASKIYEQLGNTFSPDLQPRGLKHRESSKGGEWYHILRETNCPAIIVECGFLTSPGDINTMKKADFPRKQALAIANAIDKYYFNKELLPFSEDAKTKESFLVELKMLLSSYEGII